jgi:hypothetical protein
LGGDSGYSLTIPAGSFQWHNSPWPGRYSFQGSIDGVALDATINPLGSGSYAFNIQGAGVPASDLPTANPVKVLLFIGNYGGST